MTTTMTEAAAPFAAEVLNRGTEQSAGTAFGSRLRAETAAIRLRFRWPGNRRSLDAEQTRRAAGTFDADTDSVSASKKLFDTHHPAFRAATSVRTQASDLFKRRTLPYIEPGVRLLRRDDVQSFELQLGDHRDQLSEAVAELCRHRDELIDSARHRLGNLFDASDYPDDLADRFAIEWDYPSVDPPEYLRRISPHLYEAECERVRGRFTDAVAMAESAFAEELSTLVSHLAERLDSPEGTPKVFRDSAVTNLREFFDRFEALSIRSDADLDELVRRAREVTGERNAGHLRSNETLRRDVRNGLIRVEASLDQYMTDRPRRSVMRNPR